MSCLRRHAENALEMIRIAMQMRERLGRDLRPDDFTDDPVNDAARNRLFK